MHIADTEIVIRTAAPSDARAVRAFLERLSPDSRWLRYHSPSPKIRSWMVDAVACADHDRREALVAAVGNEIVGVAEWGRMPESVRIADVAIVVDERYRRRGIARALLRHLAKNGRDNGIDTFVASVLSTNRPTIALVQSVAPSRRMTFEGTTVSVEVPLSA